MLYGYLSRVYTDLVSLPPSEEMTGERSLHFPETIYEHHVTVLTARVMEQYLGCYQSAGKESALSCATVTVTVTSLYGNT